MSIHRFGGLWTDKKLRALGAYLTEYRKIFLGARASYFKTIYVDGFAGTGERADSIRKTERSTPYSGPGLFGSRVQSALREQLDDRKRGSVRVSLELHSPFDSYLFVEKSKARATKLRKLIATEYQSLESRCQIKVGDANSVLQEWCIRTDWSRNRAVVFLDPYGMSVEWKTIRSIAATKAIDMWILFPLGAGMNRMLTRGKKPPKEWGEKLTRVLGTDAWKTTFYKEFVQTGLFRDEQITQKVASWASMRQFFLDRLESVFSKVSPQAMYLKNSRGNPMYLLCFAAGNPKGAPIAVKIASYLLRA